MNMKCDRCYLPIAETGQTVDERIVLACDNGHPNLRTPTRTGEQIEITKRAEEFYKTRYNMKYPSATRVSELVVFAMQEIEIARYGEKYKGCRASLE